MKPMLSGQQSPTHKGLKQGNLNNFAMNFGSREGSPLNTNRIIE